MDNQINFTSEELLYIEKVMDLNASIGGNNLSKFIETFMFVKATGKEEDKSYPLIMAEVINELAEAQMITKSIRNKIEQWRKNAIKE